MDEVLVKEQKVQANRCARTFEIAPDGSKVRLWMSVAYDMGKDQLFHPTSLFAEIKSNVGLVPPVSMASGKVPEYAEKLLIPSWDHYSAWQAKALT